MLRMILLGVGTAVPDIDRENTHMVWESPEGLLLIDAGGSTYQRLLRAQLDPLKLQGIFLTHTHADHLNGLAVLLFQLSLMRYPDQLPIYGSEQTLQHAQRIVDAFELESHQVAVDWIPVGAGEEVNLGLESYRLHTAATMHSRPCLALRFESQADGQALVYSADTEPCESVQSLANGATVLIHEATTAEPFPHHTTPHQAGEVAVRAGVEQLVLVHFSPRWTMGVAEALAAVRAGGFTGKAEIGNEFASYTLKS
ncbi:MAG: MBL fold metallo-hydrolase [Chloroflexi bacterium AL-W]|nr:MBL fold metallo-hydrolase [Chloroflexi bacterium AL-N1]NOK68014.1 MBL fold metallo-hydrolase [Chloroflexi bacterium AL-N10]NOK73354.1 MBL fold metallo-hydrolase [Chloroflexi bacterium AL-N5]NOK83268.1 MBL fold metallo-hydrolase [Chloroflexi bacterium AL-W]NOK87685.1 MBL fold metallo-hydrolase [Chloroflexi bacterium AL-N15]